MISFYYCYYSTELQKNQSEKSTKPALSGQVLSVIQKAFAFLTVPIRILFEKILNLSKEVFEEFNNLLPECEGAL